METALTPSLSLHHRQIWLQIPGLGPFSEFSRTDYCFLKFLELTWFLLQSLIIRASAMWDAGNQLCSCETFDLKQDSRLLKSELCKLSIVQWAGGPCCEMRLGGNCWCSSTPASFPLGLSPLPASAQLWVQNRHSAQMCCFWGTRKQAQGAREEAGSPPPIFSRRLSNPLKEPILAALEAFPHFQIVIRTGRQLHD